MELPKQILGGHYSFPKQYWDNISETGESVFQNSTGITFQKPVSQGILLTNLRTFLNPWVSC